FFWHLLHLPITFFYQRFTGEISSRIKLNEQVSVLLSREAATNLLNACMLIFFAAAMFYYDAALTFTSIGIVFINLIALHYVSRKRRNANRKLLQERGKLIGISMGGIRMMDTYKSTGAEDDFFQQWSGYQARVLNVQQELEYSTHILSVLPNFLSAINISIVLLFGGGRIISGSLTVGQLIAFYSLLLQFSEPVTRLVNMGSMMQIIDANLAKLDDVLNYPADLPKQTDSSRSETCRCSSDKLSPAQSLPSSDRDLSAQSLPSSNRSKQTEGDIQILLKQNKVKLTGAVELKNVTFGYSRLEPPLIDNLCIKIMPGQ
ncbi:MAG TPA: ABC transporter transmembrane domain-containing protein, partial [bacterium]|nr:ABC transporter transmembrane domain-containing protein [bacterium]